MHKLRNNFDDFFSEFGDYDFDFAGNDTHELDVFGDAAFDGDGLITVGAALLFGDIDLGLECVGIEVIEAGFGSAEVKANFLWGFIGESGAIF